MRYLPAVIKRNFDNALLTHMDRGDMRSAADMFMCLITGDVKKAAKLMRDAGEAVEVSG